LCHFEEIDFFLALSNTQPCCFAIRPRFSASTGRFKIGSLLYIFTRQIYEYLVFLSGCCRSMNADCAGLRSIWLECSHV